MAHWNPYYSGPIQDNSYYEDQNQQVYNALPYGAQYQQFDQYYATNYLPNAPATIRTAREVEAEQLLFSQSQENVREHNTQSQSSNTYSQAEPGSSQAFVTSNLTATAAEFKPSTSNYSNLEVKTQTFSNNNYKDIDLGKSKRNVESKVKNDSTPGTSKSHDNTNIPSKGNFMKFSNKKSYNKYDNSFGDRYNKPKDKDKYKSNRDSRDDLEPRENNSTKYSNGSGRFPNSQRDNYYSSKNTKYNNRNGANNYSRNSYEFNDRSVN